MQDLPHFVTLLVLMGMAWILRYPWQDKQSSRGIRRLPAWPATGTFR